MLTSLQRAQLKNQKGLVLWFTGLSGAGKSTLANALEQVLYERGLHTFLLDGDQVRTGLCVDLGFSATDRSENLRRVGEVAKLMTEAGLITLAAFIAPFAQDRKRIRALFPAGTFIEIYCACPLQVCEQRDLKGLYKRARLGEIADFTGISSPYEPPTQAEIVLDTNVLTIEQCIHTIMEYLRTHQYLESTPPYDRLGL